MEVPLWPNQGPQYELLDRAQRLLIRTHIWRLAETLRQVLERNAEGSIDPRENGALVQHAATLAEQLGAFDRAFFPKDHLPVVAQPKGNDMEFNLAGGMPETRGVQPEPDADFEHLRLHLAHAGVELHRVDLGEGRQGFTLAVRGSLRTLDSLPQVMNYAKCLGLVIPSR